MSKTPPISPSHKAAAKYTVELLIVSSVLAAPVAVSYVKSANIGIELVF
jgi:hypothetical protein